jgi:ornithine carbamoyltransferase
MPALPYRRLWSPDLLLREDLHALLDNAAVMRLKAHRLNGWQPLRGRRLALLCLGPGPAADAFSRALGQVGGSVALLGAKAWAEQRDLPGAARLLGRLYDAIDGGDASPALIEHIDRYAGVPVFNGIAQPEHPLRLLAELSTMREASGRPLTDLCLHIAGDPAAPPQRAAATLARLAGMTVQPALTLAHGDVCLPDAVDFVLDPSARPAAGRLTVPNAPAVEQARIATLLAEHQHCALQALVVSALG